MDSKDEDLILTRVTLSYSVDEDRIRFIGLKTSGERICLWLTQRLVNRLVPVLNKIAEAHLIQESCEIAAVQNGLEQSSDSVESEIPLDCDEGSESFLVRAIDVTGQPNQIILLLRGVNPADRVLFSLPAKSLGRWFSGLRECFRLAEWSQDVWGEMPCRKELFVKGAVTVH